jgi:hypothetical protein
MVRTTAEAVGLIIELTPGILVTPFIEIASALVDDHLSTSTLTSTRLEQIERLLAAHFYALRDRRVQSERAGPVSETKEAPVLGKGLEATTYGQQAMALDSSGALAAWQAKLMSGKSGMPQVFHLGSDPATDAWTAG